ncbi:MAG TPA: ABC transporter ATP-binding protein [Acholeplasma sp.]|nr:ABC transporter ATP-binding protein [Acholeplasma sp.]
MFRFLAIAQMNKGSKKYMILNMITALIGNVSTLLSPLFIGYAVEAMKGKNNVNFEVVTKYLMLSGLLYAIGSLLLWLSNLFAEFYAIQVTSNYKEFIYKEILESEYKGLYPLSSGDVMMKLSLQMDMVYEAFKYFLVHFIPGVTTLIFTVIMLLSLNYLFALTVFLMVPILIFYTRKSTQNVTKYFMETHHLQGKLSDIAEEGFSQYELYKAYQYENHAYQNFKNYEVLRFKANEKSYFLSSLNNPSFRLISNISYLLLGVLFAVLNLNNIEVKVGTFTTILVYGTMFFRPINELSNFTSQFLLASTAYKNINDLLYTLAKESDGTFEKDIEGNVEFKKVNFSYKETEPLISNFNLKVRKGSKIGIVGKTGAGKTTIANLLLRFYKVQSGEILLDNININEYKNEIIRHQIGLILQKPWLFRGTIFDNISYGVPNATLDQVIEASKLAGCHDFIKNFKDGYDTVYDDNDGLMSQGQKQLITIARAILLNPKIIIIDEATSYVDSLMEKEISDAFKVVMKNKTTFMIAHRLKTVMDADCIIVMDDGKIKEIGTHDELIQLNGYYKTLFDAQV